MSGRRDVERVKARNRDANLISNKLPGKFHILRIEADADEDEDDDDGASDDSTMIPHLYAIGIGEVFFLTAKVIRVNRVNIIKC